jgi:hypothetical protein
MNQSPTPVSVVIDGTFYGNVEAGMYNSYAVHPGFHNIRATNSALKVAAASTKLDLRDTAYITVE